MNALPQSEVSRPGPTVRVRVREVDGARTRDRSDQVATEEPLEIRIGWPGRQSYPFVVTMRTPGVDFELATGLLYGERMVHSPDAVRRVRYCTDAEQLYNTVSVDLDGPPDREPASRHGAMSSACGVCGKQSLDELELRGYEPAGPGPTVSAELLRTLPDRLRTAQNVFGRTGGLHAAGLFSADGEPRCVREDIGRHNAVDKVVGWSLLNGGLPATDAVLVVSGRAGYEICQKALAARIPFIAAVGAPSSLAVDLAQRFGVTLVGFLRGERFVVYSADERITD